MKKLILLHGALGAQSHFNELAEELSKSFEVYTLNFDGHGGKESSDDFSIELFSQNLLDFIGENSLEQASIFGYSMGGYVALNAALLSPNKIGRIITLGTKFDWSLESAEKEVKMLNPTIIEEKIPQFAEKLKQEHQPQDWKLVMTKTAKMMLGMGNGLCINDKNFSKIEQDIILGIGSLDNMVSVDETARIAELLPNSKLVKLEGVKHPIDRIETAVLVNYIKMNC